jgi:hypothetical protein
VFVFTHLYKEARENPNGKARKDRHNRIINNTCKESAMKDSLLDTILAIAIGLCLTMAALAWFDVLFA